MIQASVIKYPVSVLHSYSHKVTESLLIRCNGESSGDSTDHQEAVINYVRHIKNCRKTGR